jgi:hypothetical protein
MSGSTVTSNSSSGPAWRFVVPTALGPTTSSYEIADAELRFESDDVFGGSQTLRWDSIHQGCTAAMPGLGGPGAPDFPAWVPAKIEWLMLSRVASAGEPFMRMLPQGADRDAIVAALQARLGSRWIGARLPLKDARARLGIVSNEWSTLKVAGIVVAVLLLLALLIVLLALLLHPLIAVPAGIALGAWLIRKGLTGFRQADIAAATATAQIGRAAAGLAALKGRAVARTTTPAGLTGRPCTWWDVTVSAWYADSGDRSGQWQQLASRSDGTIDVVEIDDGNGPIPVWLHGAQLMLLNRTWDSTTDTLPTHGVAFLQSLGFPWHAQRRLRVTESGLEANAPLYVLGTVDERRNVALPPPPTGLERIVQMVRSGEWKRALVGAVPAPARVVVAVLIGYLGMMVNLGYGKDRGRDAGVRAGAAVIPDLAPTAKLVWQGRAGDPFIVSDRPEHDALAAWRKRSTWWVGIGIGVLCLTLYWLVEFLRS